jgi:predicted nucleic acid-binding protein
MTVFVDTSAWFAAVDRDDRWHGRAREILASGEALITSDHVLVESWLLMSNRINRDTAHRFWESLRDGIADIEWVIASDLDAAWTIGLLFPDQHFSLIDCTSFALMERLGLTRAASFDDDFVIYRYGRNRNRAFEVVR